jgi:hypothetical protein
LPYALGFFAEYHDFILSMIEIEAEPRLDLTVALAKVCAGDVIDVDHNTAPFGVSELDKFHHCASSKKSGQQKPG